MLRLSGVFVLVAPSEFQPNLLVRVVTSATSLELVATKASLLIVIAAIAAVSCARTNFCLLSRMHLDCQSNLQGHPC